MNPLRRDNEPESGRNRESRRPSRGGPPRRPPVPVPPSRPFRTMAFWALVVLLSLVAYRMYQGSFMTPQRADISYTRFVQEVDRGNIKNMQVMGKTVTGEFKSDATLKVNGHDLTVRNFKTSILGDGTDIRDRVWAADPDVEIEVHEEGINWLSVLFTWLPLIVVFGVWLFLIRQMQSGGSAALKFGKTKAKVLIESSPKVTFKDVAGCDEAKQELQEVIDFLKEPQKFQRLGGRIPKGALMLGPPGSGKTLLAKAVAGEAGVPFFSMSGSDFVEMFVGVGASVTADTPVLVRHDGRTELREIGQFVDSFYPGDQEGFVVPVEGLETLGFEERDSKFKGSSKVFVKGSAWKKARAVYRHRVSQIYEIHYLGGVLRTTGDHSVFVRTRDGIKPREARELKPGDVLVQLPMKVRGEWSKSRGTPHDVRGHAFDDSAPLPSLEFRPRDEACEADYAFALEQRGVMPQAAIGAAIGVSQMTVSNWQGRRHVPRELQPHISDVLVPETIPVTTDLMRLFGYYVAEGRDNGCVQFVFGSHETDLHHDVIERMERVFAVRPKVDVTEDHATRITYYSAPLGRFFSTRCGTGSRQKRVPELLWDLPYEHFLAFLTGYSLGDGYTTKEGKLSVTSVSRHLIRELTWLCAMHGIPCGVRRVHMKAARVIKSKPLPETEAWNLIIGRTSHPLAKPDGPEKQGKKPVVQRVEVKPYDGYVYDLCGCDNEAFFGGEKPMLLHNSRVRDLFEQGKRNAPCLTGDAVVTLSGGRQVTIEEMFDERMVGVKVPTMTDDFRFEDATVIGITRKPAPDLFEIVTGTSAVRATGNHLFPVLNGNGMEWVAGEKLREGDYVAAPRIIATTDETPLVYDFLDDAVSVHLHGDRPGQRRTRLGEIRADLPRRHEEIEAVSRGHGGFGGSTLKRVPPHVHEDVLYVCGLLASDGTYGRPGDRTIQFTNTSPALHDRVGEILEVSFGYAPKRHQATRPQDGVRDCWNTHINHSLLCDLLRAIEARLLELPAHMIAAWLRGVFDGDGCVRVSENSPQIIYSAWDERTDQSIRDALLRVGIPTSCSPAARAHRDGNIVLSGRDTIARFVAKIGTDHPERSAALQRVWTIVRSRTASSSRNDATPAGEVIRAARGSIEMGQRAFRRGHAVTAHERGLVTPSRGSLQAVVEEMDECREARALETTAELDQIRDLAHSAVIWTRVNRVERIAPGGPVYDLCLDRNHNFIVNRLFTHNCIIFIDEIDAVGRHRGAGLGGGHDEREQTLNQLLVEMDGFDSNEGVIMIAATNRPDVLDPALLRPGRFDRQIVVDWPDVRGREGILKVHTRKIPLAEDVDLRLIARATPGMAGADIANLVNEAALLAARRNLKKVTQREFEDAKDKVQLGTERKSLVMSEDERRSTAYHEAGHALAAWLLPGSEPVDKVTIIPRGRALGVTSYLPHEDRHSRSKDDLIRTLCMMMGGRAAEYIVFNHLTTGASNDLERATALARKMVCELGMSENLGPLTFGKKDEMVFLGREIATHKDYSEQTAVQIDQEVRSMVEGQYNRALELLRENIDKLHLLAKTLLEREVIDGDQMNRLLKGETLEPIRPAEEPAADEPKLQPASDAPRKDEGPFDAMGPAPSPSGA